MPASRSAGRWDLVADPRASLIRRLIGRIRRGRLTVVTPNGERIVSDGAPGEEATLHLRRWRALSRVLTASDIGFAQAVIDGDCTSPDFVALLRLFDRNMAPLGGAAASFGPARWLLRFAHAARANTRAGSARNIMAHYDLGNAFFAAWLDRSMSYSSAIYEDKSDTLEAAQTRKLERDRVPAATQRRRAGAGNRLRLGRAGAAARRCRRRLARRADDFARAGGARARAPSRKWSGGSRPRLAAGLPRYRRRLRPHRIDRNVRGGRRKVPAALFRDPRARPSAAAGAPSFRRSPSAMRARRPIGTARISFSVLFFPAASCRATRCCANGSRPLGSSSPASKRLASRMR